MYLGSPGGPTLFFYALKKQLLSYSQLDLPYKIITI